MVAANEIAEAITLARSREFAANASSSEREAATLWASAVDASPQETQPTSSLSTATLLLALAEAMSRGEAGVTMTNVLLQLCTALSTIVELRIVELGTQPYTEAGTPLWFDAIQLGEMAYSLSLLFRGNGDISNEMAALDVRGRVTTHMLGHCLHRVGAVMLDSARCAIRLDQAERAVSLCDALVQDFSNLVTEWENDGQPPDDEDEIALRQLIEAIDLQRDIQGRDDNDIHHLRDRCLALVQV